MEITNSPERTKDFVVNTVTTQTEGMLAFIPTEIVVMADVNKCYDEDFIKANNLRLMDFGSAGGCIVAFPGNIEAGHYSKDLNNTYGKDLEKKVVDFLTAKGLNVTVDNNDVLVDGKYKVYSWARAQYNWLMLTSIHCSITCDAELVDKVCTKPMNKIPKGLADYGITTEEMLALLTE